MLIFFYSLTKKKEVKFLPIFVLLIIPIKANFDILELPSSTILY